MTQQTINPDNLSDSEYENLQRVAKLLNVQEGSGATQAEAEQAIAHAQKILAKMNIDIIKFESLGITTGERGQQRTTERTPEEYKEWTENLWLIVAEANFCVLTLAVSAIYKGQIIDPAKRELPPGFRYASTFKIVGRKSNIIATRQLGMYLENTITRLTKEAVSQHPGKIDMRSAWAKSYRRGMLHSATNKILEHYKDHMPPSRHAYWSGIKEDHASQTKDLSTATDLVLTNFAQNEYEKNYDTAYGEGAHAMLLAKRAEQAKKAAEEEQEYTRWAAENPEKARKNAEKEKAKRLRNIEKIIGSGGLDAYRRGVIDGDQISLHQQLDNNQVPDAKQIR